MSSPKLHSAPLKDHDCDDDDNDDDGDDDGVKEMQSLTSSDCLWNYLRLILEYGNIIKE